MNNVNLIGHLTRSPELQYMEDKTALCNLGLAVNDNYKNKSGELVEKTVFVDVVVWGKQAEATGKHMTKGNPIAVEGKLQLDQWEKDGEKRQKLCVRAERVHFLHRAAKKEGAE
jgi:single-strand DNA-binding protein